MNLRGGLLIGLWRGYWLAAKLSDEKFRVCRFWTSPVQNVAGGSSVPQLSFCDTVTHINSCMLPRCVQAPVGTTTLTRYGQLSGTLLRSTPRVITKNFMQSARAAAVTPYHVYDGISVLRTAREHGSSLPRP